MTQDINKKMTLPVNKKYGPIICDEKYMPQFHIKYFPKDVDSFVCDVIESLFEVIRTNLPLDGNLEVLIALYNSKYYSDEFCKYLKFVKGGYIIEYRPDDISLNHIITSRYTFKTSEKKINVEFEIVSLKKIYFFELIKYQSYELIPIPLEKAPDPPETNNSV